MARVGVIDVLGAPAGAVLLFSTVLAYLGVHILRRQVIFVDLALGQVAALGVLVGYLFGLAPASLGAQVFAVGFTLVAAAVFSVTRGRGGPIPQEAIIGVVFAVANAFTFIVVDRSPHGAEHVTDILAGVILWAKWETVARAAVVVGVAAAALGAGHHRLVALAAEGRTEVHGAPWLDFLFFACFGLVISVTVRTAGVLPTFAMLVAPALVGGVAAEGFRGQFLVASALSAVVGLGALGASYLGDLPGGPTLVVAHGAALLVAVVAFHVVRAPARGRALGAVFASVACAALARSPRGNPGPAPAAQEARR